MLTESFIAASAAPPKLASSNSAALKDAGIFYHSYQPQPGLRASYKKSTAAPNCVAVSPSHIFAAQVDKAIIHVYDRAKGAQEATASFPERITSIALLSNLYLAIGFQNGALSVWEILTGRVVTTTQAHLQPVTFLAADINSNFLLSAAADSTILVWLLSDLLRLATTPPLDQHALEPYRSLTAHRAAVTALAIGHGASGFDVAVSGSKDRTAILWDYQVSSEPLATYLLPDVPLALAFEPADRAIVASYADGSVQCIDILSPHFRGSSDSARAPIQPPKSTLWPNPSPSTASAATALSISYDGTTILTGHTSGKICAWGIADKRLTAEIADYPGAPITNLTFLPPNGLGPSSRKSMYTLAPDSVVKPRVHEPFSGTAGNTILTGTYAVHARLPPLASQRSPARVPRRRIRKSTVLSSFTRSVQSTTGFSAGTITAAAEDIAVFNMLASLGAATGAASADSGSAAPLEDFMALDDASATTQPRTDVNEELLSQLFTLQRERGELLREQEAQRRRRRRKALRRAEAVDRQWEEASGANISGLPANVGKEWAECEAKRTGKKVRGIDWQSGSELSSDSDVDDNDEEQDDKNDEVQNSEEGEDAS